MATLKAFGPLDVRDASGQSLTALLSQSKRAALLTYLVLSHSNELVRRDHLLSVFWPELDQTHGRNALSQSLSFLRRELGDGVLVTRGADEVGVDAGAITSDVRTFEEALAAEDWAGAVEAYGGDLLEGLHVVGAAPFTDWVDRERERLREAASGAAWKLAHEKIAAEALTEAERVAQRALMLVPTDESPVRGFIEALAGAGDRAAALRFYERFREVLADELEVEPAPETVAVMEAVRGRTETVSVENGMRETPLREPDGRSAPAAPLPVVGRAPRTPAPESVTMTQAVRAGVAAALRGTWRLGRASAVAWVVLVGVALGGYGLHARSRRTAGPGSLIGEGIAAKYDEVVVADLSAPFDPGLGATASELLRTALDQSDIVRPVAAPALGAALRRMQRDPTLPFDPEAAREVATRDGYPLVVSGEIEDVGTTYLLTVRLELPTGDVLARFNGAASESEVIRELDRIGGEIRARIGDSRRAIRRSPPLERVTTASLEALRLYTEATRLHDWEGRNRDAIPLLERAVKIDTAFASAYRKLYVTLSYYALEMARRTEVIELAYRHRDRLTEFERLQVENNHFYLEAEQRGANECQFFDPLIRRSEAYLRRHPEDPRPLQNYGVALRRVGRDDDAIGAWRRRIELTGGSAITYSSLVTAQSAMGNRAAAREMLEEWRANLGESRTLLDAESVLPYAVGDYDAADSLLEAMQSRVDAEWDGFLYLAQLDVLRGKLGEAGRHVQAAKRQLEREHRAGTATYIDIWRSLTRLTAPGDSVDAVRDVAASLDRAPSEDLNPLVRLRAGLLYALAGELPRAREVLDTLTVQGAQNWAIVATLLRAPMEIMAGNPDEGLHTLAGIDTGCSFTNNDPAPLLPLFRARTHEAAGRPDSAIASYEAYLAKYPEWEWDSIFLFDTLERLGRLYERQGDGAKAAATYARAADLWKDADPELRPRVQRLRERAAELTATEATSPGGAP